MPNRETWRSGAAREAAHYVSCSLFEGTTPFAARTRGAPHMVRL